MPSPSGPQDNFNWGDVAPDALDSARAAQAASQVRIMFAMGRSRIDVQIWLEEFGFTPEQAEEFLEQMAPHSHQRWSMAQLGGMVGAGIGGSLSLAVTLVLHPWTETWAATRTGVRGVETATVDPAIALGYWLGGLVAFTIICGILGMVFGQVVHRLHRGDRE